MQASRFPEEKARFEKLRRTALQDSLKWYSQTYRRDMSKHWHGIQKLALEAALTGRISDPMELMIVRRVAQIAFDEILGLWEAGRSDSLGGACV